jgi:hypothetical protein
MDEDETNQESVDTEVSTEDNSQAVQAQEAPEGNPAWGPLRDKLDPISFKAIEEDLKKWDSEAQKRIETVNGQYKPFKELVDRGFTIERISQAVSIAEQLDSSPEIIYEQLGKFLQENGRMPTKKELTDSVKDEEAAAGQASDENSQPEDPRIQQLLEQQEQFKQFLEAQQQQELNRKAEDDLNSEIAALKEAHKDFSDEDIQEVIRRAAFRATEYQAQGSKKIPTLEESAAEYVALQQRILSTPRPGDSAPRLVPTSGGVPSGDANKKSLGQLTSEETQDLLAGVISGAIRK